MKIQDKISGIYAITKKMRGRTGTTGYKYTDEQKEHLRQSHLGYVMPEEQKAKISAGLRRHHGKTEQ